MPSRITWTIAPEPVGSADADALHRAYIEDIVGRYHGRPATPEEIDQEVADPAADLAPPHGVLLIAREGGAFGGHAPLGSGPASSAPVDGAPASSGSADRAPAADAPDDRTPAYGAPAGCAGVRLHSPGVAELTRVWVRPAYRRLGLGSRLLAAAEEAAAELGAAALRLDTRSDLTEARRLYARHGYREIPPYHDGPYADHFFEKRLRHVI